MLLLCPISGNVRVCVCVCVSVCALVFSSAHTLDSTRDVRERVCEREREPNEKKKASEKERERDRDCPLLVLERPSSWLRSYASSTCFSRST